MRGGVLMPGLVGVLLTIRGSNVAAQGPATPMEAPTAAPTTAPVVFDGVTVVDVDQGGLVSDQRVVIAGRRIQAVGAMSAVALPAGAQVVDARGKFLIPGLWDMHLHNLSETTAGYAFVLAYGITGVRDLGNRVRIDSLLQWRRAVNAGVQGGPRVIVPLYVTNLQEFSTGDTVNAFARDSGGLVNGDSPEEGYNVYRLRVGTPDEARRAVAMSKHLGVDLIKLHTNTGWSRDVYFALAAEARRLDIPFAGHLPYNVTMAEASDSGQRSLEHLVMFTIENPCWRTDSAGERECAALAARLRRNGTWLTPTVVNSLGGKLAPLERRPSGWYLHHIPDPTVQGWHEQAQDIMWFVHRMREVGFPLLAGTDGVLPKTDPVPPVFVHRELLFLVEGGLTALEALRTATLNPARYLGATDSLGTVAPGKLADLVLLDADPLADIANTQAIRAVVANGRYYDRAALDRLKDDAQADDAQAGGP